MKPFRFTTTCATLVAVASVVIAVGMGSCSSKKPKELVASEQKADRIVVVKSKHTMTLMAGGRALKAYKVALGRGPSGPKEHEGDNKTPEGEYVIDQKNVKSRFHLALHISYPNAGDKNEPTTPGSTQVVRS